MPTYSYRCTKCGHELEVVQKMSDAPLKRCPSCKAMKLARTFHPVGIVLKGPGFYKTDSRTTKKPSDEKKPAEDKKTETKTTDAKSTDTKSTDTKKKA